MKVIKLFCSGGMSTSFLARKLQEEANQKGLNYQVSAHGIADIKVLGEDADIILLAPQIAYMKETVEKDMGDKTISLIDRLQYGRLLVEPILNQIDILLQYSSSSS